MEKKGMTGTIVAAYEPRDDGYTEFLEEIRRNFALAGAKTNGVLYTTDVSGLWETFLSNIPADARQRYACRACQEFVEKYGGLVSIDESGKKASAVWGTKEPFFGAAISAMVKKIGGAKVNGVFVSSEMVYGRPVTGVWRHMAVAPVGTPWSSRLITEEQEIAEKRQDKGLLQDAVGRYSLETVNSALRMLMGWETSHRARLISQIEWLKNIIETVSKTRGKERQENLIWRAVANAPSLRHIPRRRCCRGTEAHRPAE